MDVLTVQYRDDAASFLAALMLAGVRRLVLALGGKRAGTVTARVMDVEAVRHHGIAILRMLMLAGCALSGRYVAALRYMFPMVGTQADLLQLCRHHRSGEQGKAKC